MTDSNALAHEAHTLLTYVTGARPPADMVELYCKAVDRQAASRPLALPALLRRFPSLLRAGEPVVRRNSLLADRIYMATLIAETQSHGSRRLYSYHKTNPVIAAVRICAAMLVEALLLAPRILISIVWRP